MSLAFKLFVVATCVTYFAQRAFFAAITLHALSARQHAGLAAAAPVLMAIPFLIGYDVAACCGFWVMWSCVFFSFGAMAYIHAITQRQIMHTEYLESLYGGKRAPRNIHDMRHPRARTRPWARWQRLGEPCDAVV